MLPCRFCLRQQAVFFEGVQRRTLFETVPPLRWHRDDLFLT